MIDVAKRAGVSPMTVSRAFKQNSYVNPKVRRRVLAAAEEIGYVFDFNAAGLSSRKSGFIAMSFPSVDNANFAATVKGLTHGLDAFGSQLLLGYTNYNVNQEEVIVNQLLTRRPEGIVVTGGAHTDRCRKMLENSGIPVVEIWDIPAEPIDNVVGFSNPESAAMVARHMVERGYSKLAFIGGDETRDTRGRDRRVGFQTALKEMGLESHRMIDAGALPITMRQGARAVVELLNEWPDTDGVMCVSDPVAFGVLTECQRMGVSVPDDLAIAGFGAYDLTEMSNPSITTVDPGAYEIGERTASLLTNLLSGDPVDAAASILNVKIKLVVGETT